MTAVVSLDSTAVHVIQDIVTDFQSRGINLAFAMVGNRADKTLRKARLKDFIGEQWFFPTVNEAVHYCLMHQQAKQRLAAAPLSCSSSSSIRLAKDHSSEISINNDVDRNCTVIAISVI